MGRNVPKNIYHQLNIILLNQVYPNALVKSVGKLQTELKDVKKSVEDIERQQQELMISVKQQLEIVSNQFQDLKSVSDAALNDAEQ